MADMVSKSNKNNQETPKKPKVHKYKLPLDQIIEDEDPQKTPKTPKIDIVKTPKYNNELVKAPKKLQTTARLCFRQPSKDKDKQKKTLNESQEKK